MTVGQQIFIKLLRAFPKAPTNTLARKAYAEYPEVWTSLDAARSCIRHLRGNKGKYHRRYASKEIKEFQRSNQKAGFSIW